MTFATDTAIETRDRKVRGESRDARHHAQLLASVADVPVSDGFGGVRVALPAIRGPPNIHEDALLDRRELSAALSEAGFPVSAATLATKAVRGGGPPYQLFGRKPLYRWGAALEWARSRLSRPVRNTSEASVDARHHAQLLASVADGPAGGSENADQIASEGAP